MEKNNPPPYSETNTYPQPGFYPPLPQQQQQQQQQQPNPAIVMVSAPTIIASFGPQPQTVTCPYCHHQICTRVETEAATKTHLFAAVLCLFGCIPCCLIPYCTDSCQNRNHYCPSCGAFLGAYSE